MDNFQTEVLELEFNQYSHGFNTITEESFAKILLRYTSLSESEHELYLERLRTRIPEGKVSDMADKLDSEFSSHA